MLDFTIHNIRGEEIDCVFKLHLHLWNELLLYRSDIYKNISNNFLERDLFVKDIEQGTKCSVLEINNLIVAYSTSYICTTIEPERYVKRKFAFINELYVESEYRNKGIATSMIKYLINYYKNKGIKTMELFVLGENLNAYNLYTKIGFSNQGFRMELKV